MSGKRVPSIGNGNPYGSKIAIVGEAPGENEERLGEPFIGASGQLLNHCLERVGIRRADCFITNVVKTRPPLNDFSKFYLDKGQTLPSAELLSGISELREELTRLRPNVILALGGEALRALTGKRSIEKWRGSVLSTPLGKVLPSYHPAKIFRVYENLPVLQFDFRKAAREQHTPNIHSRTPKFHLSPSLESVGEFIHRAEQSKRLAFDIETSGRYVRCLGLAFDINEAMCIPFLRQDRSSDLIATGIPEGFLMGGTPPPSNPQRLHYWSEQDEYHILQQLDTLFRNPKVEKVAQNAPFDMEILAREYGIHVSNLVLDTMLAQHCCYIELPKGLDFLASVYTDVPYYSDYDASSDVSTWTYNCWDCVVTLEASRSLEQELQRMELGEFYRHQYNDPMLALTRAGNRGVKIDVQEKERRKELISLEVKDLTSKIESKTWVGFNPNSTQQKQTFLYEKLKLPIQFKRNPKTKENRPTTDVKALDQLATKFPQHREIFQLFLDHSAKEALLGFLNRGVGEDGRIRTHYNVGGTDTRRLSSSEPLFEIGTNLQNIPRGEFRRLFISEEGYSLLKADLSQAEFRAVVWFARIQRIIDLYQGNPFFDIHKWNAATNIFLKPEGEVTKIERKLAKDGVYGGNYKMRAKKASLVYKMPVETAELILARYYKNVPEIQRYWAETEELLRATRSIESPLGSKRIFYGRLDEDTFRAAYSYRAQELVATIINRAFALGDEIFNPLDCHPLLQVHDEIVWQVRDDFIPTAIPIIKNIMEYEIPIIGVSTPLIIPVEMSVGKNWFDQKEVKV